MQQWQRGKDSILSFFNFDVTRFLAQSGSICPFPMDRQNFAWQALVFCSRVRSRNFAPEFKSRV
jgi:hypothetical protein